MSELWHYIKSSVVPHLSMKSLPRWLFVDLADPAKRDDKDLIEAIEALADLQPTYNVILGLNKAEALRLLKTLGREGLWEDLYEDQAEEAVEWIRKKTTFSQVIIHFAHFAVVSAGFATFNVKGPFCADPVLTTGGGDNFNGGFCNGLLYGFDIEESLLTAVATSGFYVRFGSSPTMMELADFLKDDRYWNNY
jgi:sugar/nucleoside kinase (ribokinase family)